MEKSGSLDTGKDIFKVGLTLSIEAYFKTRQTTRVLGWQEGKFLLIDAIFINGQPSKLKTGDPCTARVLKDGIAYGFESEVIAVQFYPFPLMFIKYPADIAFVKIRVSDRFTIDLPVMLSSSEGTVIAPDAAILDISEGGCGIKVPVKKGVVLSPDMSYTIRFRIMEKELNFGCRVRAMDKRGDYAFFMGVEFTTLTPQDKETLTSFFNLLKKHKSM